jgi:hypothetical protein
MHDIVTDGVWGDAQLHAQFVAYLLGVCIKVVVGPRNTSARFHESVVHMFNSHGGNQKVCSYNPSPTLCIYLYSSIPIADNMQVLWILYHPNRLHYVSLLPATGIDKLATSNLQKSILQGLKDDAKHSKLRVGQVPSCIHLFKRMHETSQPSAHVAAEGDTEGEDEGKDAHARPQLHQGIDADGVVRDLEAYLQGGPSVVKKRLQLVFPLDRCESNTNVWT